MFSLFVLFSSLWSSLDCWLDLPFSLILSFSLSVLFITFCTFLSIIYRSIYLSTTCQSINYLSVIYIYVSCISLSISCLSLYLSTIYYYLYLCIICLFPLYLSASLSLCIIYVSMYLSMCLSTYLSIDPFIYLSIYVIYHHHLYVSSINRCLSIYNPSTTYHLPIYHLSISIYLSIHLPSVSLHLLVFLCLSVSLVLFGISAIHPHIFIYLCLCAPPSGFWFWSFSLLPSIILSTPLPSLLSLYVSVSLSISFLWLILCVFMSLLFDVPDFFLMSLCLSGILSYVGLCGIWASESSVGTPSTHSIQGLVFWGHDILGRWLSTVQKAEVSEQTRHL